MLKSLNLERWEKPCLILIAASWLVALIAMPLSGIGGFPPFLALMPGWMLLAGTLALSAGFVRVVQMMLAGHDRPLARFREVDWAKGIKVGIWTALGGLHMVAFMSIKPQLNYLIPFWADPTLARIEATLFFGDPWRVLQWINNNFTADYYHRGWFVGVVATLIWQLCRETSKDKSAKILAYFFIWTSGPLIHCLLPAGGPIFFERLGYGSNFAGLSPPGDVQGISDYLWRTYVERDFAMGAGISAMPSLHIATAVWVVLCCRGTKWAWAAWPFAISIFLLSISLGWHYALDGVIGGLMAWFILLASRSLIKGSK